MADRLARARTATLLGSVLTALSSGTNYVYSAYAPQLGSRLHITHTQLNIIGLSGNMGVYTTGPFLGRIVDRRGPRPLLIMCFILLLTGYMGLKVFYDNGAVGDSLPVSSLIFLSAFSYMTGAGGNCGLTAGANSTAKSFPERMRATTVGFVLSGFGLSAFFFSSLSHWFFPGNTSSFLLFLSLGTSLPVILGFFTVHPVPHAERPESIPGGLTWESEGPVDSSSRLLASEDTEANVSSDVDHVSPDTIYPEVISAVETSRSRSRPPSFELSPSRRRPVSARRTKGVPSDPVDTHGKRLLTGWEFWLIFIILSLLSGTGLMWINNVGSIAQALSAKGNPDYDKVEAGKLQSAQVSLVSLANCGARIGIGASADFVKHRFSAHRSYLLIVVSLLFISSQVVASRIEETSALWRASLLLGLGYGGIFGLLPTITIEWFGMNHFSENWGFVSLAPLFGGNVFSILFGRNFDSHVSAPSKLLQRFINEELPPRAPIPQPGHECLEGRTCYSGTLAITTFACTIGLFLSLVAGWRDRRRSQQLHAKYEELPGDVIWDEEDE